MTLKLNGSSSGYTAIDAPAAAGSNTLTLPTTNGSAGQVLTTDGNGNLSWKSPGKILQVVHATYATEGTTSGSTEASTGLTVTIQPASTSNKIFVDFRLANVRRGSASGAYARIKLYRGDAAYGSGTQTSIYQAANGAAYHTPSNTDTLDIGDCGGVWLDSPNSTSNVIYTVTIKNIDGSGNIKWSTNSATSSIIAMEIAA